MDDWSTVAAVLRNACGLLAIFVIAGCGPRTDEHNIGKSTNRLDIAKDFLRKHELEAADSECTKAIAYNPSNDEAYVVRGLISMVRAVDTQRTLEIEGCLTGVDAEATRHDLDMHLAKADTDFEHATRVTPDYGEAFSDRGVVHNLMGEFDVAAGYLAKALENPQRLDNAALTRAHLGWSFFNQKKYVEAAKELRQVMQFQPKMCVATYRLARVYFAREEWDKAAELFQTASDDPSCGSQEASYYLMKTRMQQGLMAEAKLARDACLKISPKSCVAAQCRTESGAVP